jgi:hypothetical protein
MAMTVFRYPWHSFGSVDSNQLLNPEKQAVEDRCFSGPISFCFFVDRFISL